MKVRPVVPRATANRDVELAIEHYLSETTAAVALRFLDALEKAYGHLARHPAAGSPRYGHELLLPGLRTWRVPGFPYLVFYRERPEFVDVWRVLHAQRDIPEWMQLPEEE